MKVEKYICDVCGEEIPKGKTKDIFGVEREYYRFGKIDFDKPLGNMNCRNLGLDLCERCAGYISLEIQKSRTELLLKELF